VAISFSRIDTSSSHRVDPSTPLIDRTLLYAGGKAAAEKLDAHRRWRLFFLFRRMKMSHLPPAPRLWTPTGPFSHYSATRQLNMSCDDLRRAEALRLALRLAHSRHPSCVACQSSKRALNSLAKVPKQPLAAFQHSAVIRSVRRELLRLARVCAFLYKRSCVCVRVRARPCLCPSQSSNVVKHLRAGDSYVAAQGRVMRNL
jgi:hypothetical protein